MAAGWTGCAGRRRGWKRRGYNLADTTEAGSDDVLVGVGRSVDVAKVSSFPGEAIAVPCRHEDVVAPRQRGAWPRYSSNVNAE